MSLGKNNRNIKKANLVNNSGNNTDSLVVTNVPNSYKMLLIQEVGVGCMGTLCTLFKFFL